MKKLLILIPGIITLHVLHAQTQFFSTVKIEYEKTINVPAFYKELDPEWYEFVKDQIPKTDVTYYDFIGDSTHSIYKPGREGTTNYRGYRPVADKNVVFTDYSK